MGVKQTRVKSILGLTAVCVTLGAGMAGCGTTQTQSTPAAHEPPAEQSCIQAREYAKTHKEVEAFNQHTCEQGIKEVEENKERAPQESEEYKAHEAQINKENDAQKQANEEAAKNVHREKAEQELREVEAGTR